MYLNDSVSLNIAVEKIVDDYNKQSSELPSRYSAARLIVVISEALAVSLFLFLVFYPFYIFKLDNVTLWLAASEAYGKQTPKFWEHCEVLRCTF